MTFTKIVLLAFALVSLTRCSTHPEILPYVSKSDSGTEDNSASGQSLTDSVFAENSLALNENEDDEELPTEFDDSIDTVQEEPAPKALVVEKSVQKTMTKNAAKTSVSSDRLPASEMKNGFYTFNSKCMMKAQPDPAAADAGNVSHGKKLWLDAHDSGWFKAYKKSGTVFVPASCVQ